MMLPQAVGEYFQQADATTCSALQPGDLAVSLVRAPPEVVSTEHLLERQVRSRFLRSQAKGSHISKRVTEVLSAGDRDTRYSGNAYCMGTTGIDL